MLNVLEFIICFDFAVNLARGVTFSQELVPSWTYHRLTRDSGSSHTA